MDCQLSSKEMGYLLDVQQPRNIAVSWCLCLQLGKRTPLMRTPLMVSILQIIVRLLLSFQTKDQEMVFPVCTNE